MQTRTFGTLRARVAGGPDRQGGGDGPVVVLLHGFGASGEDLVPLHRVFRVAPEVRWVFPEAPLSLASIGYGHDSRAWWMIDLAALERALSTGLPRDRSQEEPVGLPEARDAVRGLLDAVEEELRPSRLVLGGFSQGAMLSLDVALHDERPLAGLVQWSGTLLAEPVWRARMPARAGLRVLQSHGDRDPLLPFDQAERLRDLLREGGLDVTFVPFRGGHEIPGPVIDAMQRFLDDALG